MAKDSTSLSARTGTLAGPANGNGQVRRGRGGGLAGKRHFTHAGRDPFEALEWEIRTAQIRSEKGEIVFEQAGVEVPKSWSQTATNVVASKYFRGILGTPQREHSVKQLIGRVVDTIHEWGEAGGYFQSAEAGRTFAEELQHILVNQMASFNSPVWFNIGVKGERQQASACQPYHAMVSTPEGMIPIGRLVEEGRIGHAVYDSTGITRIVAVKVNGTKPVRRVRLKNGSFIEATPDHVVQVLDTIRGAPRWARIDELRVGMRLCLHAHRAKVATSRVPVGVQAARWDSLGTTTASIEGADPAAVAEAALAGWLQADGFVGQYEFGTNRSLTIEFQVANEEERAWVERNLDIALPGIHRNVSTVVSKDPARNGATCCWRIRLYGEVLRSFVTRWGLLARREDLRVPDRLWNVSNAEIAAYLKSVFQADGYVSVRTWGGYESATARLSVISERWPEEIQLLLLSLGIYSRRHRAVDKRPDRQGGHVVSIGIGSERARFAELVGFVDRRKQRLLLDSLDLRNPRTCTDVREELIVAIDDAGDQEVYDIQTENGNYLSNNVVVHNCFINSVEDTMESILSLAKTEGMLFKYGSGTGSNLSALRSSREPLAGGGTASGPVSFMKGFDAFAGVIKSGGKTRRAAKMVILNIDHPDIVEFIKCKVEEEKKAWTLIEGGYDPSFTGPAYSSIFFQNSNNSVRVTDTFMETVRRDGEWTTRAVTTRAPMDTYRARDLMRWIAESAHACGDPGMQFDTTINHWHTSPNSGRINASNPCSEYMYLDDSACNLASLNLMKFVTDEGHFDVAAFRSAVQVMITAMEILVGNADYPTKTIEKNSHDFRPLGLGYANLGALLMAAGLPYDSPAGRDYAGAITAIMTGEAYAQSARIAGRLGPFAGFPVNREAMLRVMEQHRSAVAKINPTQVPSAVRAAAHSAWRDACELGAVHGYRNGQATVLAPTGTIAFMMDCDTTGVEPDIALVKYKKLVGGGLLKIVNHTVPLALRHLGYHEQHLADILEYIDQHDTIEGAPHMREEDLPVFDCAFQPARGNRSIQYMGHLRMMAAVQPFISGAISKTVNLPESASVEDICDAYIEAWRLGLKAIAVYRDNSKRSQPLNTTLDQKAEAPTAAAPASRAARRRLPDERRAITHKFDIQGHEGYLTVGMYEDGTPGEIFLVMAKEGSTISGLMDSFATMVSLALQYGVPLKVLVDKFSHVRFEPAGYTGNPEIPIAKSVVDYIFRYLASKFLDPEEQQAAGVVRREPASAVPGLPAVPITFRSQEDAPSCSDCGAIMVRNGACYKCMNCGSTSGCS